MVKYINFSQLGSLHTSGKHPFPCKHHIVNITFSLSLFLFFNSGYDPLIHSVLIPFLKNEIERFNKLLSVIHKSLKDLQLSIKGESILTPDLEETYDSFLRARVPMLWQVSSLVCWLLAWDECQCSTPTKLTVPHEEMVATILLTYPRYKCEQKQPIRWWCGNPAQIYLLGCLPQSCNSIDLKTARRSTKRNLVM